MQAQLQHRAPPVREGHTLRSALDPFGIGRAALAVCRAWQPYPTAWLVPLLRHARAGGHARLVSAAVLSRCVLTAYGRILGIVNPPVTPPRRKYWSGVVQRETPESWRERQAAAPGTWRPDWLDALCATRVPAREAGAPPYARPADAPGTFLREL